MHWIHLIKKLKNNGRKLEGKVIYIRTYLEDIMYETMAEIFDFFSSRENWGKGGGERSVKRVVKHVEIRQWPW